MSAATQRLDRAVEIAKFHGRAPLVHRCPDCEVEVLRATLALIGEAMVAGLLVWTGKEGDDDELAVAL